MIDIHTHLLPDIDDGPESMDISVNVIKDYSKYISSFFATPHYIRGTYQNTADKISRRITTLQDKLQEENIHVSIVKGSEVYLEENIHRDIKKYGLNLGDSEYVLVESNRVELPANINSILYEILKNGYKPILCHPERYNNVVRNINIIEDLMYRDILIQVNLTSLVGQYGKQAMKTAWKLLQKGHVHFLATDSHGRMKHSTIPSLLELVEKEFDSYTVELLTSINPKRILNNEKIETFYLEKEFVQENRLIDSIISFFRKKESAQ